MNSAWKYSAERLALIRHAISGVLPEFVTCVAVSGSLARMEAHAGSDVDLMVVVDDRTQAISETDAMAAFRLAWEQLDALGAVRPKPGGIFSVCVRWRDLIAPAARGKIDEDIITFGHRIQLLMDAQPIVNEDRFVEVQRSILYWYTETRLAVLFGEPGPFHWLWQDVQRYWRSLRARTCWLHADDGAKAVMLNVKLRSSRLLLVFAFLRMLDRVQTGATTPMNGTIDSILRSLALTPVERLFEPTHDIQHWNTIWKFLKDRSGATSNHLPDEIRAALAVLAIDIQNTLDRDGSCQRSLSWLM